MVEKVKAEVVLYVYCLVGKLLKSLLYFRYLVLT